MRRKNEMPTSKKKVCRNLNVSMSSSSFPRNSFETLLPSFPSGPPVMMVERKRPMEPRPPTLASIESAFAN